MKTELSTVLNEMKTLIIKVSQDINLIKQKQSINEEHIIKSD